MATHIETGVRHAARTNETGNFTIPQLAVGKYEVSMEAAGFRRLVRRDIVINVAQTLTLNATLEVGQVLKMVATDPGAPPDMEAWSRQTGNELLRSTQEDGKFVFYIRRSK